MNGAIEWMLSLQVSDVMHRNVVRLPASSTMAEAANILLKHGISGAPVVDELNRCIGVLSSVDFVKRQHDLAESRAIESSHRGDPSPTLGVSVFDNESIERYMTPVVQSTAMDASLMQAARIMDSAHVHRVPVLDGRGSPIGMITSLDIVAALVQVIEEQSQSTDAAGG